MLKEVIELFQQQYFQSVLKIIVIIVAAFVLKLILGHYFKIADKKLEIKEAKEYAGITTAGGIEQTLTAARHLYGIYEQRAIAAGIKPTSFDILRAEAEEDIKTHVGRDEYIIEIRHKPQFIRIPRTSPPSPAELLPGVGAPQQ